jgi:hypothetical protein
VAIVRRGAEAESDDEEDDDVRRRMTKMKESPPV